MKTQLRESIIERLADLITDKTDIDDILNHFRDGQIAYLEDQTDNDLLNIAETYNMKIEV